MLANILQPYEDEMLHSWIERNGAINGFDNIHLFLSALSFSNPYKTVNATTPIDSLFTVLEVKNWSEMYVKHTEYPLVAPFLESYRQIEILNSAFGIDSYNTNSFVKKTLVCPLCQKERPYFRVWHNLPDVKVCHKHRCSLVPADYFFEKPESFLNNDTVNQNDVLYAKYCHDLLQKRFCCDVNYINNLLGSKSKKRSRQTPDYIRDLMNKYPSVDMIPLPPHSAPKDIDGYIVLSHCGNVFEFRHTSCETRFCTTADGFNFNFRCPSCAMSYTDSQRFEGHVHEMTEGRYKLIGPFNGQSNKVNILHKECGVVTSFRPISFLLGSRCRCENFRTPENLNLLFKENYPDYIPLSYENERLTIQHRSCGNVFQVSYKDWIRKPSCRICDPVTRINYETLKDEMNNYNLNLISYDKSSSKTKVTCECPEGHVSTVGLYYLREIKACPQCLLEAKENSLSLLLQYIKEKFPNSLFFYDDIIEVFGKNAKRLLQALRDKGLIVLVAKGCYALPKNTYSTREIIEQKYIARNDECIGFLYGTSFLYYCLGIGTKPTQLSIATKKEAKPWGRLTHFANVELRLKSAPTELNEQNREVLQISDFIDGMTSYCVKPKEVIDFLLQYIENHEISKGAILEHLSSTNSIVETVKEALKK